MGRFPMKKNSCRGRSNPSSHRKKSHDNNNKEYKFYPLGMGKNKAKYEVIKDKIENDIQQTFRKGSGEIVKTLREMKLIKHDNNPPQLKISNNKDNDEIAIENKQYKLDYTEDKREHKKKKELYANSMEKTYAKIWDKYTSEPMSESEIRDKPIELLTRVREVMMMPKKSRYHYNSMTESILSFLLCKQKEYENLRDYYSKWKQTKDNLKEHIGDEFIRHFVKQSKRYKEENDSEIKNKLEKDAFKHWTANMLVRNSSDEKYGSLKQELKGRYGGKFDEYPRSPEAAYDRLMEHKWDNFNEKKKKATNRTDKNKINVDNHLNMNQRGSSNRVCWVCGSEKHIKTDCDILKKDPKYPHNKWFINQVNTQRRYNQYQEQRKEEEQK